MSEVTRGVIGMPLHLAMSSELSRRQFHSCAQQVFAENVRLSEQVAALQAAPDSWQSGYDEGRKMGTKTALGEREQLGAECEESAAVIDRLAQILAGVAVALKGEELPLHRHGYHDLVEGVTVLKLEAELLKVENERLQRFETAYKEFSDKTDWVQETAHWSELGMHRADVLRKRCDDLTSHNQAQADEIVRLREDAERYRWLRDGAGYCDTRDIPGMAPARMDAFIDAAMAQEQQS
jgi:hypothetical protein